MDNGSKSESLINPFMSNAKPAAKTVGWALAIGATAFGAHHLTQQLQSMPPAADCASTSGKSSHEDRPSSSELDQIEKTSTRPTRDLLLAAGGACGLLGVAGGAFGFHGLKRVIAHRGQSAQELVQFWQIATQYQLYHSAGIIATAGLPERSASAAAGGFLTGIALFSGSIYAYVLTGHKAFQYLTPFGGLSFMAGWGAIALYHLSAIAQPQDSPLRVS